MRLVLIVLLAAGCACAQQASVTLELRSVTLSDALRQLSAQGRITILGDPAVKGSVTCSLNGVTPEQALNAMCKSNDLLWSKVYVSSASGGGLTASRLIEMQEALKKLGDLGVIWQDGEDGAGMVFAPSAGASEVSALASGMKMKSIYLVRGKSPVVVAAAEETGEKPGQDERKAEKAARAERADKADQGARYGPGMPPGMSRHAQMMADQAMSFLGGLPVEERIRILQQLRWNMAADLSPQDRKRFLKEASRYGKVK